MQHLRNSSSSSTGSGSSRFNSPSSASTGQGFDSWWTPTSASGSTSSNSKSSLFVDAEVNADAFAAMSIGVEEFSIGRWNDTHQRDQLINDASKLKLLQESQHSNGIRTVRGRDGAGAVSGRADEAGVGLGWSDISEATIRQLFTDSSMEAADQHLMNCRPRRTLSSRLQLTEPTNELPMPIGTPADQTNTRRPVQQQQPPQLQQPKLSIGHEIDKWIASVTSCAPLPSCNSKGSAGSNRILVDKATLLSFLGKLKMHQQKKREMRIELCAFCRQNQEPFHVYTSHRLADINGNVTCPVLFRYVCPICGVSGSKAHTIKYCPLGNGSGVGQAGSLSQRQRIQSMSGF